MISGTSTAADANNSLKKVLESCFENFKDNVALRSISPAGMVHFQILYSELFELAKNLAQHLDPEAGPVLVISNKDLTGYGALAACPLAGCCFVPISFQTPIEAILKLIAELQVRFVIALPEMLKNFEHLEITTAYYDLQRHHWIISPVNPAPRRDAPERRPLYIALTSGSTSAGKAIAISSESFSAYLKNYGYCDDLSESDRVSQIFNLNFDPALGEFFYSLMRGAQLCIFKNEEIVHFSRLIKNYQLTRWWSTPTMARVVLKLLEAGEPCLFQSVLRSNFVGEKLSRTLASRWLRFFPNSKIENTYGPTETTVVNCRALFSQPEIGQRNEEFLPVGKAFGDNQVYLVDEFGSRIDTPGVRGEIVIEGSQVGMGYIDEIPRGYEGRRFRTGDSGYFDPIGDLYVQGRIHFEFKVMGERFNHEEVVALLCRELKLEQLVLLPHEDLSGQITCIDAVLDQRKSPLDIKQAHARFIAALPSKFWPANFFYIANWPLNQNFKTDIRKLSELIQMANAEKLNAQ